MNRSFVFLLFLFLNISNVFSQSHTTYNVRGDQALEINDYNGARNWYGEGLGSCNLHSIKQLTKIWKEREDMRRVMARTMRRCFNCIEPMAKEKNPEAMQLLSEYYKLGIAIGADSTQYEYWRKEYGKALGFSIADGGNGILNQDSSLVRSKKSLLTDKFYPFIAYTYSPTMPLGVTIGGFSKFGLYLSYKTSASRKTADFECNNTQIINTNLITDVKPLYRFDQEKWISEMLTGGILFPLKKEKLYFSLGGGYAKRDYFRSVFSDEIIINNKKSAWCHNVEASYECFILEIGGLFKWKKLIVGGGVNSTTFEDIDGYISLGLTF